MARATLRRFVSVLAGLALVLVASCLFLWPGMQLARAICCQSLHTRSPPGLASEWHRALAPAYADWAEARIASGRAEALSINDIAGTEWPLFGTVFFLRATENLEDAWHEAGSGEPPSVYARRAIDAAANLLADPSQADWVKRHWGREDYLRRENVFYRMLVIDGLAAHARLTGSMQYRGLLGMQSASLATELDASATGLLADYPGQTFPADVAAAWHAILRADRVLGTDHTDLAARGLRGFVDGMAPQRGLPPYAWFGSAEPEATEVRGSANAWLLLHAPFVWPEAADAWIAANDRDFWEAGFWVSGYREYARDEDAWDYADVDSGPVIAELGTSASAFGLGAQRTAGDFRRAYPLALEMIAASWPLPGGRLLLPRVLSDVSDAPLLGEAAVIYNLTALPAAGFSTAVFEPTVRDVPGLVWLTVVLQLLLGTAGVWRGMVRLRAGWRR